MVVTDSILLIAPRCQALAMTAIQQRASLTTIFLWSFSVFGLIAFAGIFRYAWRVFYIYASLEIAYELRNDYFRKLMSLSPRFFTRTTTGDLMARATNDIDAIRMATGPGVIFTLDLVILSFTSIVIMVVMNPRLALVSLLPVPLIAIAVSYYERLVFIVFDRVQAQFSLMSEKVRENFSGIRVIKAYCREPQEIANFERLSRDYVDHNMKLFRIEGIFRPVISLLSNLAVILIILFGLRKVMTGELTLGNFWAFNEYLWLIVWPLAGVGWLVGLIQRGAASLERVVAILKEEPEIAEAVEPEFLATIRGEIEFRNVSFRFSNEQDWVLRNVSFRVEAGEKLGILGQVGAGKSALINLLLRFYDPQEGQVLLDGIDIRRLRLSELRRAFGPVPQESFLFSESLRANIGFSLDEPAEEKIRFAADVARLTETIDGFPRGFDTVIGEKGVTLSGGQKQRTAIARALIAEPRVIVLDDSLSHLDTQTEESLLVNLRQTWQGRTAIIISHRISAIRHCDRTIVLEAGRITGCGRHDDLVNSNQTYRLIHARQHLSEILQ